MYYSKKYQLKNTIIIRLLFLYLREYAARIACLLPEAISLHECMVALLSPTLVLFWHIFATNNSAQCEDISSPKKLSQFLNKLL